MKWAVIVYNKSTCSSSFPNLTVNYRSQVLGVCLCHKFIIMSRCHFPAVFLLFQAQFT